MPGAAPSDETVRYIPVAGPPGPPGPPGQPGISITGPKGEPGNYPYGEPTYNLRPGTYTSFTFLSTFKSKNVFKFAPCFTNYYQIYFAEFITTACLWEIIITYIIN